MKALEVISSRAAAEKLLFLLAGGHAVIVHGHARATFDLDLIISRDDRELWSSLVRGFGYTLLREGPTFLQYDAGAPEFPPLDLMLVSPATFAQMMAASVPSPKPGPNIRTVSLQHLLALKCHALKHSHSGRTVKDADGVIRLVQLNRLDLNDPVIRQVFLKYGTPELYEKSEGSASEIEAAVADLKLELPDWSGMDDSSARVDVGTAFHLCEQYVEWVSKHAKKWNFQRGEKCLVEFVL